MKAFHLSLDRILDKKAVPAEGNIRCFS